MGGSDSYWKVIDCPVITFGYRSMTDWVSSWAQSRFPSPVPERDKRIDRWTPKHIKLIANLGHVPCISCRRLIWLLPRLFAENPSNLSPVAFGWFLSYRSQRNQPGWGFSWFCSVDATRPGWLSTLLITNRIPRNKWILASLQDSWFPTQSKRHTRVLVVRYHYYSWSCSSRCRSRD